MTSEPLFAGLSGRKRFPQRQVADVPLVVALHGGSYSSAYFDVAGHSLLDRAAALGVPILAPDRPGHGDSAMLPEPTIAGNARALTPMLADAWSRYGEGTCGIVLIGHSIGAAIALSIAAAPGGLRLLGVAVSGVGLRVPDGDRERWEALPDIPHVDLPSAVKDMVMFGPAGSFALSAPEASRAADAPAVRGELVDITSTWSGAVHGILGAIRVPVHYRQGEFDRLWIVDQAEIDTFANALTASPRVDAAMPRGAGHCMDFHRIGPALHAQQLGFALQCAAEAPAQASAKLGV